MKRKLNITTSLLLMAALLLTACTSAPSKTNSNIPSSPSASIAEVDRTEEYVQIMRETLIELYDYDIEEPPYGKDSIYLTYDKNLSDEFKAEKKHKFKNDFKRIVLETLALPFQVIEFFEFTDEKDFDRCKDWIEQRFTDPDLLKCEEALLAYPNIVLVYSNDAQQEAAIKIISEKLGLTKSISN